MGEASEWEEMGVGGTTCSAWVEQGLGWREGGISDNKKEAFGNCVGATLKSFFYTEIHAESQRTFLDTCLVCISNVYVPKEKKLFGK